MGMGGQAWGSPSVSNEMVYPNELGSAGGSCGGGRSVGGNIAESLEGDITIESDWLSEHVGVMPEDCVNASARNWRPDFGPSDRATTATRYVSRPSARPHSPQGAVPTLGRCLLAHEHEFYPYSTGVLWLCRPRHLSHRQRCQESGVRNRQSSWKDDLSVCLYIRRVRSDREQ
jgi:hypothetical protein